MTPGSLRARSPAYLRLAAIVLAATAADFRVWRGDRAPLGALDGLAAAFDILSEPLHRIARHR